MAEIMRVTLDEARTVHSVFSTGTKEWSLLRGVLFAYSGEVLLGLFRLPLKESITFEAGTTLVVQAEPLEEAKETREVETQPLASGQHPKAA